MFGRYCGRCVCRCNVYSFFIIPVLTTGMEHTKVRIFLSVGIYLRNIQYNWLLGIVLILVCSTISTWCPHIGFYLNSVGTFFIQYIFHFMQNQFVFTYAFYAANMYHHVEYNIHDFACPKSWCNLERGISTRFQVIGKLVMYISSCFGQTILLFVFWKFV